MSNPVIRGIHHITLCASGAQEDVDFLSQVLGLRLIKQTVLFDGRYAHYHLYYANANAEIGSVLTTFPYRRIPGRPGTGQISATAYTVPKGSLPFWIDHLTRHNVDHGGIQERFGQSFIRFRHPSGLFMEVIEDRDDTRAGWTTKEISADVAARGFHGPVLSVREIVEQERFFVDALGFRKTGTDGAYHRFEVGSGGAAKTLVLYHEPDRPAGSWGFGAGTGHHLALDVGTDDALAAQKNLYEELGYTDCSEIKDRNYFHSIYVRSPGGILTECAASVPEGFGKDEPIDQLGMELLLPPWFEDRRAEIVAMLEPITVPEANRPAGASTARSARPLQAAEAAVGAGGVAPSRRTTAEFIGGDVPSN
ncbi:MAG: ring-cleaving dioxygenase [Acidobacteria bacterium]|nr:MAG: ring-cleaving dioxygenase [Acidobacteriota bacterium]